MKLEVAAFSRVGGREVNEDAYGAWADRATGGAFFVLADGAGGHGGGDVASRLAVERVLDHFRAVPVVDASVVADAIVAANEAVVAGQAGGRRVAAMRSTIVVLAIDPAGNVATWGHVGDSRLYHCRDGVVIARTRDHSVVQGLVDSGGITADEALGHPLRNRLLAAIGEVDAHVPALSGSVALLPGDRLLLCSDGVWEYIADAQVAALALGSAPDAWLRGIEQAVTVAQRPGADNFTALAIACEPADPP